MIGEGIWKKAALVRLRRLWCRSIGRLCWLGRLRCIRRRSGFRLRGLRRLWRVRLWRIGRGRWRRSRRISRFPWISGLRRIRRRSRSRIRLGRYRGRCLPCLNRWSRRAIRWNRLFQRILNLLLHCLLRIRIPRLPIPSRPYKPQSHRPGTGARWPVTAGIPPAG